MQGPWYLPTSKAAKVAGISEKQLRDYVNSREPPPTLAVGKKKLVSVEGLRAYLKAREE